MTAPQPPRDLGSLIDGTEVLEEALEGLRTRVETHVEAFLERLDTSVTSPLREAFETAMKAHETLRTEGGLTGNGSDPGDVDPLRGNLLTQYRDGVRGKVLEPLRSTLEGLEIGDEISQQWRGFRDGFPGVADSLPGLIHRPEPADVYAPISGDGRITRVRKAAVRGWRRFSGSFRALARGFLRILGRESSTPLPPIQSLPLRRLAKDCLLGHCPLRLELLAEDLHQHYARPLAHLEAGVAEWTESWFAAEEVVRASGGHLGTRFLEEISRDLPPGDDQPEASSVDEDSNTALLEEASLAPDPPPTTPEVVAETLKNALASGAALGAPEEIRQRILATMEMEWDHLMEEIRVAGSFLESAGGRKERKRLERLMERGGNRARSWEGWHQTVLERAHLCILLLRLREELGQAESHLMGRIVEEALAPLVQSWNAARTELGKLEEEATAVFQEFHAPMNPKALAGRVDRLRVRAEEILGAELASTLSGVSPVPSVRKVGDQVAGDLADSLRFLPETVSVAPLQEDPERVVPTASVRQVPFREMVLQTVDVLRLEALRNSSQPLQDFLRSAEEEWKEIPSIVSFNLTAARDELTSPPEGPLDPVLADARSLTVDGLARTAQGLEGLLGGLADPWKEFTREADDLLRKSFQEIHTRAVAEGVVQEQMLDLRAQAQAWIRRGGERAREWARWVERRASRTFRRWRVRGAKLVHLGRAAVGTPSTEEGEADRAMETLRGIPQLLDSLPLVYRRLYSFQPVSDPNLLVGRETEMEWVARRLEAWRTGRGVPCVLTGPVGVGHTSLLNVLSATHLDGLRVYRMSLDRRMGTEESLAPFLAEALEIADEGPWTLTRLERFVLEDSAFQEPSAVLLEHLEHLFLRVPGGTDLLEKLIALQARTSGRVFWLSNTSGAAWKVVQKSEARAAALLMQYPLSVLSRPDLERLVMARHRRSGLPVEFVQPGDLNPLLRRRLRRTRGDKARQEIIREDFFDRVYRMSDGNVPMAILLWLRSADFSSREGWLQVVAPRAIRFAFLEELDLTLDFALKGFLEHGSLTLEEYGRVFGTGPEEAFQVFEALRSRMLLEAMGTRGGLPSPLEGVREGERYRIPGILSQVVAHRLRNRNILH